MTKSIKGTKQAENQSAHRGLWTVTMTSIFLNYPFIAQQEIKPQNLKRCPKITMYRVSVFTKNSNSLIPMKKTFQ